MELFEIQRLDELYRGLFERSREKILRGGKGDEYLAFPDTDTRMSLSLLIRIKPHISGRIAEYLEELKAVEPDLYYYPEKDFHITVMDILRGIPNRPIPENIAGYAACAKKCAEEIGPFRIRFDGLTMNDNVVMVKGYYEEALETFRRHFRQRLRENGLSLEERYETYSAHISVVRIPVRLTRPERFVERIADKNYFGEMEVSSFELTFHNWYDSKKKLLAEIVLGGC